MIGATRLTVSAALVAMALVLLGWPAALADESDYAAERAAMIQTIEGYAHLAREIVGAGGISPAVLDAMRRVERHLFVPDRRRAAAYLDRPVPIGFGQTISQPFIVALMTHLLDADANDVVLEIGTGSGYQAAVLASLVAQVCTIEIIPELGNAAAERLERLGYENVQVRVADGYNGWPECGQFDAILVTAAADHVPPPLVRQLKPGGRMAVPVGAAFTIQHLILVEKTEAGQVRTRQLLPVRFVPLTRDGG